MKKILLTLLMLQLFTYTWAQETYSKNKLADTIYKEVFKDFDNKELSKELVEIFEKHFPEVPEEIFKKEPHYEIRDLVEFLKDEIRQLLDMLEVRERSKDEFDHWVKYKVKHYRSIILGKKILRAKKEGNATLPEEDELKATLEQLYLMKLEREKLDIEQLSQEIKKLKEIHAQRKNKKDIIIERRFQQLTEDSQIIEW